MIFPNTGLYAITKPENKSIGEIISDVDAALKAGLCALQYRDKQPIDAVYLAGTLKELCHSYNTPFIINDHVDLAKQVGADGVHLGKEDGKIQYARQQLGNSAIIGVSCYNDINLAKHAIKNSADYVAFGRFYPSSSKPLAAPAELKTLTLAKGCINVPIVAIGGILPSNSNELLNAGANVLAVIGGIFTESPYESTLAYKKIHIS
jgi:thiamine-phosphate pyrophosphorylase